jgi:hypothetical protein
MRTSMTENDPEVSLPDLIEDAEKSIEVDNFDDAIALYRRAILEFSWLVRRIKTIDDVTIVDKIFNFCDNLKNIFKTLHDPDGLMLIQKIQYSLFNLISDKIPSDKPRVAESIYEKILFLQKYVGEKPTFDVSENSTKALTKNEKKIIFENSNELKIAILEIMKYIGLSMKFDVEEFTSAKKVADGAKGI